MNDKEKSTWSFTLKEVIVILTIVVPGVAAWYDLNAQVESNKDHQTKETQDRKDSLHEIKQMLKEFRQEMKQDIRSLRRDIRSGK